MDILIVIYSLFLVGIGFLMKSYPNLISGYSTMSAEKRKNVDVEAVGRLMQRGFLWIGVVTLVGYYLCRALSWNMLAGLMMVIPMLVGALVLMILAQKYDHNPQSRFKRWLPVGVVAAIMLFVVAMLWGGAASPDVIVGEKSVEFTGQYGVTIPFAEIEQTELLDAFPEIEMRTNGFALGDVRKGHFRLADWGKCRLLMESSKPPYLLIRTTAGDRIIFCAADAEATRKLAEELQTKTGKD